MSAYIVPDVLFSGLALWYLLSRQGQLFVPVQFITSSSGISRDGGLNRQSLLNDKHLLLDSLNSRTLGWGVVASRYRARWSGMGGAEPMGIIPYVNFSGTLLWPPNRMTMAISHWLALTLS